MRLDGSGAFSVTLHWSVHPRTVLNTCHSVHFKENDLRYCTHFCNLTYLIKKLLPFELGHLQYCRSFGPFFNLIYIKNDICALLKERYCGNVLYFLYAYVQVSYPVIIQYNNNVSYIHITWLKNCWNRALNPKTDKQTYNLERWTDLLQSVALKYCWLLHVHVHGNVFSFAC